MLKSPKAAIFSLAAVALRFHHLRIFQNDEMEEKRREKEKNFQKVGQNGSLQTEYLVRGKERTLSRQQKRMSSPLRHDAPPLA